MRKTSRVGTSIFFFIAIVSWTGVQTPLVAASSKITVTSANPNSAAQGTVTLDVDVSGSGFANGAKAQWFESGTTNPGGVTVNSTTVNSSTDATANITISATAYVGSFDIVVTNTNGRSGKGTGLFQVLQSGNSAKSSCSGTGGATFNVTSSIYDSTSSTPFDLQNDGNSTYLSYKISKNDMAISEIQAVSCDWQLNVMKSKSRTVELSLIAPVEGQTPAPTLPAGWPTDGSLVNIHGRVMTFCAQNPANGSSIDTATSVGNMTPNTSIQCALFVDFYSGGLEYSLRMDQQAYPSSTWAQINCTDALSGQCDSWTVTPPVDANGNPVVTNPYTGQASAIGELVTYLGVPMGLYYVSFSGAITFP